MFDIYADVTDKIIAMMEQGEIPWQKPWRGVAGGARNWTNQKPYSLINQLLLGGDGEWLTMKQIQFAKGKLKKGSKARHVVFWKMMGIEARDKSGNVKIGADGQPIMNLVPILKYYNVFNLNDCEGIKSKGVPVENYNNPIESADVVLRGYLDRSGVKFRTRVGDRAYYSPEEDQITLPMWEQFVSAEEYYSTAYHEVVHSTGHKTRLDRLTTTAAFGSDVYSKEELVAEIGSAACMTKLGIEAPTMRNSAAYIQNWIKALRNDKRMIVSAACKAEKAVKMIFGENIEPSEC